MHRSRNQFPNPQTVYGAPVPVTRNVRSPVGLASITFCSSGKIRDSDRHRLAISVLSLGKLQRRHQLVRVWVADLHHVLFAQPYQVRPAYAGPQQQCQRQFPGCGLLDQKSKRHSPRGQQPTSADGAAGDHQWQAPDWCAMATAASHCVHAAYPISEEPQSGPVQAVNPILPELQKVTDTTKVDRWTPVHSNSASARRAFEPMWMAMPAWRPAKLGGSRDSWLIRRRAALLLAARSSQ